MNKREAIEQVKEVFAHGVKVIDEQQIPDWIKSILISQLAVTCHAQAKVIAAVTEDRV